MELVYVASSAALVYMAWCLVGAIVLSYVDTSEQHLLKWYQGGSDKLSFLALTFWPIVAGVFIYLRVSSRRK